jgi:hypothetical protein
MPGPERLTKAASWHHQGTSIASDKKEPLEGAFQRFYRS